MYRYIYGKRSVGVMYDVQHRNDGPTFYVEAHSNSGGGSCRVEFDRAEALRLRRNLNKLLAATKPVGS